MKLSDALPILRRYKWPNAVLQNDHICVGPETHPLADCRLGESAVYTELDAKFDTPEALRGRLIAGKPMKPPPIK
jgi:hypothetical protein